MESVNKLPARLEDVADAMLAATADSNPLLRFNKGEYFIGEDEIEAGHEYIAYPFDAMTGFARWQDAALPPKADIHCGNRNVRFGP
jgi:hypothetical protein